MVLRVSLTDPQKRVVQESKSEQAAKQVEELRARQEDLEQSVRNLISLGAGLEEPDRHLVLVTPNALFISHETFPC